MDKAKTTCRKCGVKASAFGSEFLGQYVCANCQPKHEHIFQRRKPSSKVETCSCGKFRHTENAGPSIVAVEAKATPRPWHIESMPGNSVRISSATLERESGFSAEVNGRNRIVNASLIVRAVNNHEALLEACRLAFANSCTRSETNRKWTVDDQKVHEALSQAIANAETK